MPGNGLSRRSWGCTGGKGQGHSSPRVGKPRTRSRRRPAGGEGKIIVAQKKLGELLLEAQAITPEELERALEIQQSSGERLGSILLRLEMVDSKMLSSVLGKQQEVEGVDLLETRPRAEALGLLTAQEARRLGCVPLWLEGDLLAVAMVDPRDEAVVLELARRTGRRIKRLIAPQTMIYSAIVQHYGGGAPG